MPATQYDIKSETFDQYFVNKMAELTTTQRLGLPASLLKHIRGYGEINMYVASRLTFAQKVQLLSSYCGKSAFVAFIDEGGFAPKELADFFAATTKKNQDIKEKDVSEKEALVDFVLGSKEAIDGMDYLASIFRSPMYKYLRRPKPQSGEKGVSKYQSQTQHFVKLAEALYNYEANKAFFLKATSLSPSMWYVLLYFGDNAQKKAPKLIEGALGCTKRSIQDAVYYLTNSGLLRRASESKGYYEISTQGTELLYKILSKDVTTF